MEYEKNILADYFQNGMVIQKNKTFSLGGYVKPESPVSLKFLNHEYKVRADKKGQWRIRIPAISELNISDKLVVKNLDKKQTITNLHLGQVYLLGGQSNIEFRLKDDVDFEKAKQLLKNKKYQNLFFYNVPQVEFIEINTVKPEWVKPEQWQRINSQNCGMVSAVGFWMLIKLRDEGINDPLAVVGCFKGGTSASCWIPAKELTSDRQLEQDYLLPYHSAVDGVSSDQFELRLKKYDQQVETYNNLFSSFSKEHPALSINEIKAQIGDMPWPPPMTPWSFLRPGGLYETMVSQIRFATVNAMVWYQGEDDRFHSKDYKFLLPKVIASFRRVLEDPSLPIKVIQLPGYGDYGDGVGFNIRSAQQEVSAGTPYAELVSFVDGGEEHNIHPAHKKAMGYRLGKIVSGNNYSGTPYLVQHCVQDNTLILEFTRCEQLKVNEKLKLRLSAKDEREISSYSIKDNKLYIPLKEKINASVIAYGDENYPEVSLYNELNYPIAPFRIEL